MRDLEWTPVEWPVAAPSLAGLRAVFLSDIHLGSYVTPDDLREICERVTAQEPDLILIGGDTVHTRPREIDELIGPLSRLAASEGVFAVPGNHERYPGIDLQYSYILNLHAQQFVMAGLAAEQQVEPDGRRSVIDQGTGPTACPDDRSARCRPASTRARVPARSQDRSPVSPA